MVESDLQVSACLDTEFVLVALALVRGVLVLAVCGAPNAPEANAFVSFMLAGMLRGDEQAELCYVWRDAEFHDSAVIAAISRHPDAGYLGKLMRETPQWKIPDLRPHFKKFRMDARGALLLHEFYRTHETS